MANKVTTLLSQAPLPELIERLGVAIANAQFAMDHNAIRIARMMADPEHGLQLGPDEGRRSLLELGFAPTFYHLTEARLDVRLAFSMSETKQYSVGASAEVDVGLFAASVDANYSAKYSFDAHGSSAISARLVSVPPPSTLSELLRSFHQRKTGG